MVMGLRCYGTGTGADMGPGQEQCLGLGQRMGLGQAKVMGLGHRQVWDQSRV